MKSVRYRPVAAACLVATAIWLAACAASPRTRPLNIGPPAAGADSIESVRRQLQGRWTLVSFETVSESGQATAVQAVGELTYDQYGNLLIRGALTGVPAGEQAQVLRYSGRAVIDAPNHRLVLQALEGTGKDALPAAVRDEQARYYEFSGDQLKLTVRNASGQPTAAVTWKKVQ